MKVWPLFLGCRLCDDARASQERIDVRLMSAEGYVQIHGIGRIASLQYLLTEAGSDSSVEYAYLLKSRKGIGIQHFGPLIAIVSGRIAT